MSATAVAMLLATIVAGGCNKDESAPPPQASQGPEVRAAAQNVFSLLFDGTRAQFLSCFYGTQPDLNAVGIIFDFNRTSMNFQRDFIKAYGPAAWPASQNGPTDPAAEKKKRIDEIDRSELQIDGDQATLANTTPGSEKQSPLRLVKTGGVWKVQASSLRPAGQNGDKALAAMAKMASLMAKYQKAVGKPGIKPEDITYELGRAANEQVLGKTYTEPHRFDINKIK
jgi:hypothetical protein